MHINNKHSDDDDVGSGARRGLTVRMQQRKLF